MSESTPPAREEASRYAYEFIPPNPNAEIDRGNYRVFDVASDSRVATCFLEENAILITDALNGIRRVVAPSAPSGER